MNENLIIPILYEFERFGLRSHDPNGGVGLWKNEMEILVWSALNSPKGNWIEVGSWNGGSTLLLCLARQALNLKNKIFTVDINYGPFFDENITQGQFWNCVRKLNGDSKFFKKSCPNEQISFAFIDGFHSFRQILWDFEAIVDNLVKNAIIVFHDTSNLLYANNNSNYIESCSKSAIKNYNKWIDDDSHNFLVDEAICWILNKYNYKILNIPVRKYEFYPNETHLTKFVRGTTSPYNAITAIVKI